MPLDEQPDVARTLREIMRPVREHWMLVLACVVITTAGAVVYSVLQESRYEASSRLLVEQDGLESSIAGLNQAAPVDPERATATDLALIEQPALAERVVRRTKVALTSRELRDMVTAEPHGKSRVMTITVNDRDPERAAILATAYAREYVAFRERTDRARYRRALDDVEQRLETAEESNFGRATLRQLRGQRDQLDLLTSLASGDATVISAAEVPESRVTPKPVRNGIIGLLFGLILGCLLAIVRERADPRLHEEREVTEMLPDVPVIAAIPNSPLDVVGRPLEAEGFRGLQTTLSVLDPDRSIRSLLVTSATIAEGKSTTSLNLALAMAERDEHVLLIEADMRRRVLSERLGLEDRGGLSDVLAGTSTVSDELVEVSLVESLSEAPRRNGRVASRTLAGVIQVLPAGQTPANPHALLSPARLERMLVDASHHADKVVIDGTPLGLVTDMLPLAHAADAIVVVVRLNHTRRKELRRLRELLAGLRIRPFGLVLFGIEPDTAYNEYLRRS